jgi:hypothetical protein
MFQLLKGVKWFEWVLLGVLAVAGVVGYVSFNKWQAAKDKNIVLGVDNQRLERANAFQAKTYQAADKAVAEYVQATTERRELQAKSRQADSAAFLATAHPEPSAGGAHDVQPVPAARVAVPTRSTASAARTSAQIKSVRKEKPHAVKPTVSPAPADEDDPLVIAALTDLADRMHARYCTATGANPGCTP